MVITNVPVARRRRLIPWLVAGALAGALGIFVIGRWFIADQRLADAMAAADKDNPYWRLDNLMAHREKVPDAENSALVLARVVELVPEEWPEIPAHEAGSAPSGKNAVAVAYEQLDALDGNVRPDNTVTSVLRAELKARESALTLARTVAGYERGRHELVLAPIVTETSLRETQEARRVARLLATDAALRAEDCDVDGALQSCRAILATARSIGDEPALISGLVRVALDSLAIKSLVRVLGQGEPSDAALVQVEALIVDEHAQPRLLTALNGERAMTDDVLRRAEEGKIGLSKLLPGRTAYRVFINVTGGLTGERAFALELMNEAVAIARRPTFEQPGLMARWEKNTSDLRWKGLRRPFSASLGLQVVPSVYAAGIACLRSRAELGAAAIMIAAERVRRRTGKWPAAIKEIDRSMLPKAPADPFSGAPYHFEHQSGELVIYTIGRNGKDEHGVDEPKLRYQGGRDDIGARAWDLKLRRQPAVTSKPKNVKAR
jgi:hypothetical protein